jgi:hypothetical protein
VAPRADPVRATCGAQRAAPRVDPSELPLTRSARPHRRPVRATPRSIILIAPMIHYAGTATARLGQTTWTLLDTRGTWPLVDRSVCSRCTQGAEPWAYRVCAGSRELNSSTTFSLRARHRGQYLIASHGVLVVILSPHRGQFKNNVCAGDRGRLLAIGSGLVSWSGAVTGNLLERWRRETKPLEDDWSRHAGPVADRTARSGPCASEAPRSHAPSTNAASTYVARARLTMGSSPHIDGDRPAPQLPCSLVSIVTTPDTGFPTGARKASCAWLSQGR